jgi:tRNA nucleotidyltransferase (CCA-adding enzyme)
MSDYNFLMESRLSPPQFQVLSLLSRVAAAQGLNLYLVGGAVRDLTYGQQVVRDLDFAVEGNPQRILRHLESSRAGAHPRSGSQAFLGEPVPLLIEHLRWDGRRNSADLLFSNGVRAELGMCRQEVYSKPGRRPEIQPGMIFDDLKRRDFSVNAMAVSLHPNSRGLLLDPTNGAADIERHELRLLHSRSLLEDPSRLYHMLRLGLRLGFKPEERAGLHLATAVENRVWERMDPEQQSRELRAVLREENPGRVLKTLAKRRLLAGLDKKLASARIPYDRFAKVRARVQSLPGADPFLLNFHCLVEKLGSAQKSRLAKKIIAEGKAIKLALSLERDAKKLARVLASSKASLPSQVYTLLSRQPQPLLLFMLVNVPQAKVQSRLKNFLFKFPQVRARLPRAELQALGVKPGAEFEKILERVFLNQLDGKIKTRQQLVKQLRALAGIKEPEPKPRAHPPAARRPKKGKEPGRAPEPEKLPKAAAEKPALILAKKKRG